MPTVTIEDAHAKLQHILAALYAGEQVAII